MQTQFIKYINKNIKCVNKHINKYKTNILKTLIDTLINTGTLNTLIYAKQCLNAKISDFKAK